MKPTIQIIFCFFVTFCFFQQVVGQKKESLDLVQFDISDGLSENIVISLHEDKEGYIWIGTYDGLNKFDGYSFIKYRDKFSVKPEASNNRFYLIKEDNKGRLWLYKDEGSYLFDPYLEKVIDFNDFSENHIKYVNKSDDDHIWAVTSNSEILYGDDNRLEFQALNSELDKYLKGENTVLTGAIQYHKDTLLLFTNNGDVIRYSKQENHLDYYKNKIGNKKGRNFTNYCIVDDLVWLASRNGVIRQFDLKQMEFVEFHNEISIGQLKINHLYHDKKFNTVWIASQSNGLYAYNYIDKIWKNYEVKLPGKKTLTSEPVGIIIRDQRDVLWLGTDHGLLVHDPYLKKFKSLNPDRYDIDFDIGMPRKIMGDQYNNIWIGSNDLGLWKYNTKADNLELITRNSHPDLMPDNTAIQLLSDENKLYIGHNGKGLSVIDIPTMKPIKKIPLISKDSRLKSGTIIWNIFKDERERLWVGTRASGIYIIDGDETQHYHSFNTSLTHNAIQTIDKGNNGKIVVSTRLGGVYEWNEKDKDFIKKFPVDDKVIAPKSVYIDKNGFVWIGTDGKGIFILDAEYNIVAQANVKNKLLASDVICSFIEDDDNLMWVSTNFGISRLTFNPVNYELSHDHFSKYDGLLSDEFMTGAYYKTDDVMWMGSVSGINYFKDSDLTLNPYKPSINIKDVQVYRKEIENDSSINYIKNLDLKRGEKSLSIEFNTLGFTVPDNTLYSYRLMGYDDSWSEPNKRTFISYTNLEPGDYQFEVKAANYDGLWSDKPTVLSFKVKTLFFESKFFRRALLGLFALMGLWFYRFRLNQIREKAKMTNRYNKDLSQMEMKALRAQINPHFLFNTLNSINNYILQNEGDIASHYLVKFSQLMRIILSNSESSFITLEDELNALDLYIELEGMRFANNFDYFLNIDPSINTDLTKIPPMLLQPFVENAIWHGLMHNEGDNCLEINVTPSGNHLIKISIKDNGIGRAAAKNLRNSNIKRKSYGMDITKKRIELINKEHSIADNFSSIEVKDLVDENENSAGTEINVYIPKLSKNEF